MKKFLTSIFLIFSVLAVSAQVNDAQRPERPRRPGGQMHQMFSPEQMAQRETDAINAAVGLDSLQYQLVYIMKYSDAVAMQDSMKVRAERMEKARKEGAQAAPQRDRKSMEEMMKAREAVMKKRRDAMNEQMKQILSPKQFRKYLKFEEERAAQRRQSGRQPRKK